MEEKIKILSYIRKPSNYISDLEEKAFTILENDPIGMRTSYIKQFDNELNPDAMRKLFPDYKGYNTNEFDRVVGALTEITYIHLLETRATKGNNTVFFTAGGSGSGKSRTIATLPQKSDYAIILDTTFASKNAVNKVKEAVSKGFNVRIMYVLRDPLEAWIQGVLPRAKETGRIIDEAYHLISHKNARENVLKLYLGYEDNEHVTFGFLQNETEKGLNTVDVEDLQNFTYNEKVVANRMRVATDNEYEQKQLTQEQYKAITATR
jgi:hypothetical protein